MKSQTSNIDDLDQLAFEEEAGDLARIEDEIDRLRAPHLDKIATLEERLKGWHAVDYDDIDRKKVALRRLDQARETDNRIAAYKPSPYFSHFELRVNGGDARSFFIGEHEQNLFNGSESIILGRWSPLRVVYINKSQKTFTIEVDGTTNSYELLMRRMVTIKDGALKRVDTEFDSADMTLDGQLVDPFLLSVLHDKRRDYKLSDIVKTIQQNQNEILELPIGENFIVQGCAGSGKTMILLHRLSYLAFNHPEVDFSNYVILTPNESFNRHIDELCVELDLGSVARMTAEAYYLRVGKSLSRGDTYEKRGPRGGRGKQVPKIDIEGEQIAAESLLPLEYLTRVYSREYADEIAHLIESRTAAVRRELAGGPIGAMLSAKDFALPEAECTPYELFRQSTMACAKIRREAADAAEKAEEARTAASNAQRAHTRASRAYDSAMEILKSVTESIADLLPARYEQATTALEAARNTVNRLRARLKESEKKRDEERAKADSLRDAVVPAEERLAELRSQLAGGVDRDELISSELIQAQAESACSEMAAQLDELNQELESVGFFGFGRRRRLQAEVAEKQADYESAREDALERAIDAYVDDWKRATEHLIEDAEGELDAARLSFESCEARHRALIEQCEDVSKQLDAAHAAQAAAKEKADAMKPYLDAFDGNPSPEPMAVTDAGLDDDVVLAITAYNEAYGQLTVEQKRYLKRGEQGVESLRQAMEEAQALRDEAEKHVVTADDEALLADVERICGRLDAREFSAAARKVLSEVRAEFGIEPPDKAVYAHDLYLYALECSLYYGSLGLDNLCICIDEAQDLALAEHDLLQRVAGEGAVFNLYGDTRQLLRAYKGVPDWSLLDESADYLHFSLNENYRNTFEITTYCNDNLSTAMMPIGLRGEDVHHYALASAVDTLFALRGAHPKLRCAVLYKRGLQGLRNELERLLGVDASWGEVKSGKVSVVDVESAKGLEFDAVVVIMNGMNDNELYVACTRALDNLMTVQVENASLGDTDDISPGAGIAQVGSAAPKTNVKAKTAKRSGSDAGEGEGQPDKAADPFFDFNF